MNNLSKNVVRNFVGASILAVSSFSATAGNVTVGGVTWDPNSPIDFTGTSGSFFQTLSGGGFALSGGGVFSFMNGSNSFVCGTCELTYTFGGMTLDLPSSTYAGGAIDTAFLNFNGGWVKFWYDDSADYSAVDGSGAGDGSLWLDMVFTPGGRLTGTETLASSSVAAGAGQGSGHMDIVGGTAMANFDTDTQDDGTGHLADFAFSSSITTFFGATLPLMLPDVVAANAMTPVFLHSQGTGTITLTGASIPEPETLAIFGLSLIGLGFSLRKKLS